MDSDPWPFLGKITCPVLFVEGGNSENKMVRDLRRAASSVPVSDLQVIEGAGHLVPMEKPGEILSLIQEFFEN